LYLTVITHLTNRNTKLIYRRRAAWRCLWVEIFVNGNEKSYL